MRWVPLGALVGGGASALLAAALGNDGLFVLYAGLGGTAAGAIGGVLLALLRSRRLRTAALLAAGVAVGAGGPAAVFYAWRSQPDGGGLATAALMGLTAMAGLGLAATALLHVFTARLPEARQQRFALIAGLVMVGTAVVWVGAASPPPLGTPAAPAPAPEPEEAADAERPEPAAGPIDTASGPAAGPAPADSMPAPPPTPTVPRPAVAGDRAACTPEDPPILLAVDTRDVARVREAIAAGAEVNACVDMGEGGIVYALPEAMALESYDIARVLLEAGADPDLVAPGDVLPLEGAITARRTGLVAALIEAGADVNAISSGAPLVTAAARTGDSGILRLLLEAGADPDAPFYGETPLHIVAPADSPAAAAVLLAAGATVDAPDGFGRAPIVLAAAAGRIETVRLLVEAGSRALAPAREAAVAAGHDAIASLLTDRISGGR